jgi:hypothetical protein
MRSLGRGLAGVVAGVLCWSLPAAPAVAEELVPGGGWHSFAWFNGPGTYNVEGPFTFTDNNTMRLKVTDAFVNGDRFAVYDFGALVGSTSKPDTGTKAATNNPDEAFQSPAYSFGTFLLSPGEHSLTIKTTAVATGWTHGVGFLRIDHVSSVPEPTSLTLAALGLLALPGWYGLRRRSGRR